MKTFDSTSAWRFKVILLISVTSPSITKEPNSTVTKLEISYFNWYNTSRYNNEWQGLDAKLLFAMIWLHGLMSFVCLNDRHLQWEILPRTNNKFHLISNKHWKKQKAFWKKATWWKAQVLSFKMGHFPTNYCLCFSRLKSWLIFALIVILIKRDLILCEHCEIISYYIIIGINILLRN